jgi:hypothetical protein
MARRSKSERNLDEEITTLNFVLNLIEAGRLDHIYVHPHEKATAVAFFKAKIEAAIKRPAAPIPAGRRRCSAACRAERPRIGERRQARVYS